MPHVPNYTDILIKGDKCLLEWEEGWGGGGIPPQLFLWVNLGAGVSLAPISWANSFLHRKGEDKFFFTHNKILKLTSLLIVTYLMSNLSKAVVRFSEEWQRLSHFTGIEALLPSCTLECPGELYKFLCLETNHCSFSALSKSTGGIGHGSQCIKNKNLKSLTCVFHHDFEQFSNIDGPN